MIERRQTPAAAYAETSNDVEQRRLEQVASSYRPDPALDRLLELRETDPPAWTQLSRSTRIAVGLYEGAKRAAEKKRP